MQEDKKDETQNEVIETPEVSPLRYDSPEPINRGSGQGKKILIISAILVLVLAGVGGFFLIKGQTSEEVAPTPTPTETPSPTPTSATTPTPTKKLTPTPVASPSPTKKVTKNITIRVLNGRGTAGTAKEAADYLTSLGYDVVGTGNAASFDFESTTIEIKKSKESLLAQLKIDLQTKYTIGTSSATLAETDSADAVVTVGKK